VIVREVGPEDVGQFPVAAHRVDETGTSWAIESLASFAGAASVSYSGPVAFGVS